MTPHLVLLHHNVGMAALASTCNPPPCPHEPWLHLWEPESNFQDNWTTSARGFIFQISGSLFLIPNSYFLILDFSFLILCHITPCEATSQTNEARPPTINHGARPANRSPGRLLSPLDLRCQLRQPPLLALHLAVQRLCLLLQLFTGSPRRPTLGSRRVLLSGTLCCGRRTGARLNLANPGGGGAERDPRAGTAGHPDQTPPGVWGTQP